MTLIFISWLDGFVNLDCLIDYRKSYRCHKATGPGCSKLTMSLVNVLLKFQMLISEVCQYFLLRKCEKAFSLQKLLTFFQQKISVYLGIK